MPGLISVPVQLKTTRPGQNEFTGSGTDVRVRLRRPTMITHYNDEDNNSKGA